MTSAPMMQSLWFEGDGHFRVDDDELVRSGERELPLTAVYPSADEEAATKREERGRQQRRAERELAWFFLVTGAVVPNACTRPAYARRAPEAIDRWLGRIAPSQRATLASLFETRQWPEKVSEEFGWLTPVVVRLECAALAEDSDVPPGELEEAAVQRLEAILEAHERRRAAVLASAGPAGDDDDREVALRDRSVLQRIYRANRHVDLALRAYVAARAGAPNVIPLNARVPEGIL